MRIPLRFFRNVSFALAVATTLLPCAAAQAEPRVALVIGNGAYRSVTALPNPPNDASDVALSLERLGFSVQRVVNGTFDDMRRALLDFGRRAREADMAVVFYAGHGMEVGGENWLIPVDAELKADIDIDNEAIGLKAVMQAVSNAANLGLVILDACRNNPFAAKMQRTVLTRAVARGLVPVEPSGNVLVAYAAKDGTVASDGGGRNSPFTAALLKSIETPGLEINFLFRNVRDDVMAATRREQQPFVYGSLSRNAIFLKAGEPPSGAAPPAPASTPSPTSEAAQAWLAAKDTTSPALLEAFIRRFSDTFYADLARARLEELRGSGSKPADNSRAATKEVRLPDPAVHNLEGSGAAASVNFGGPPYCTYNVSMRNLSLKVSVDDAGNIGGANLTGTMVETTVGNCPYPPIGTAAHVYSGSGSANGDTIALQLTPAAGNSPRAGASFNGQITNGRLNGTLTIHRTDIGGNLAWTVRSAVK